MTPIWGYTLSGRARVFEDGVLPPGWSADISVLPEHLRNGEAVSRLDEEERISKRPIDEPVAEAEPVKRGPGRPRKIQATETVASEPEGDDGQDAE